MSTVSTLSKNSVKRERIDSFLQSDSLSKRHQNQSIPIDQNNAARASWQSQGSEAPHLGEARLSPAIYSEQMISYY